LTEKQTALVLKWNVIEGHPLKEHLEVINHQRAWEKVAELAWLWKKDKPQWIEIFSEDIILILHSIILQWIDELNAGKYRTVNVRIAFSRAVLPRREKVPDLMKNFVEEFKRRYQEIDTTNIDDVLRYWYDLHLKFVKIHPFVDWNGRVARLLMNMWFIWNWDIINVIFYKNRRIYIQAIEDADKDLQNYYTIMTQNFEEFLNKVLELVKQKIYFKF